MVVFVGCSSSSMVDEKYLKAASDLAEFLCEHDCTLLFGSSENGMMGSVYKVFKKNNCKIISVLPKEYYGTLMEVDADEKVLVNTCSDQLRYLVNTGDLTIILPGSFGTLSELMASIQCKKVGEHNKPIVIYNIDGFYDEFLEKFKKIKEEKFEFFDLEDLYDVIDDYHEIEKYLDKEKVYRKSR